MKVCFETFGCRLNRAEALQMEAEYLAKGWKLAEGHSDADLFVVRGCSVTRRAQRDCEKLIEHLKQKYPTVPVRICGCLTAAAGSGRPEMNDGNPSLGRPEPAPTAIPTRTARAYLKCQDGCSGKCTFCIVPRFRGASVSVPFDELTDRARRFIDAGYHEIVLTGCNLALYASGGKRLPELVAALAELSPDCRIRIGSVEPGRCALETVEAMAQHENVCRFLHVPVQSGSNAILASMKRPYVIRDVEALVSLVLKRMPLVGLGCDMMTGFPGETDVDFEMSKGLLRRLPFSNVHVFPYSERFGTLAAAFPGAVPTDLRRARAHKLSDIASRARQRTARRFVGRNVELVVEDERKLTGWTGEYFFCKITNGNRANVRRKDLVRARVLEARNDLLSAIML